MAELDTYRIQSVLEAKTLEIDIENVGAFDLSCLKMDEQAALGPFDRKNSRTFYSCIQKLRYFARKPSNN